MPESVDRYITLAATAEAEDRISRSRFIAVAAPAPDTASANTVVADVRRRFHDARHVCHAWRVDGVAHISERRQDDGEPSGTGGEPILNAIRGAGLHDTVVAVARYFGGVKLGTGGLARAYGGTAALALSDAPRRTVLLGRTFLLDAEYSHQKTVQHLLDVHRGRIVGTVYDAAVHWRLWLPNSTREAFVAALHETSGGSLVAQPLDEEP